MNCKIFCMVKTPPNFHVSKNNDIPRKLAGAIHVNKFRTQNWKYKIFVKNCTIFWFLYNGLPLMIFYLGFLSLYYWNPSSIISCNWVKFCDGTTCRKFNFQLMYANTFCQSFDSHCLWKKIREQWHSYFQ